MRKQNIGSRIGSGHSHRGFSRIELLVVLSVALLLLVVELPMLGYSGRSSDAAVCRDNMRQLIQAWSMYHQENAGRLTPLGIGGGNSGKVANNPSYLGGWLDYSSSMDNIDVRILMDPEAFPHGGHLGRYLSDHSVFRCPSDPSMVRVFGRNFRRIRSVSGNNWMGGATYCGQLEYQLFQRIDELLHLPPSKAWVMMEERADSINDSWHAVDMVNNLVDYPAFYHDGGAHLPFADGHVEYWRWTDPRTVPELNPGQQLPLNVPSPDNPDLDRLRAQTTQLR